MDTRRVVTRIFRFAPLVLVLVVSGLVACTRSQTQESESQGQKPSSIASRVNTVKVSPPEPAAATKLLVPADLIYQGAFRLPDGPEEFAWLYSGQGLTYYPDGDPKGESDGTPGSLFGIGHDWNQYVSEISIPKPVLSKAKNLAELNTATTLQPFANVRGNLFPGDLEQARSDIEYLPPQGKQKSGKLYFCWGPHMHDAQAVPSHGMCELDLKNPRPVGPWKFGDLWTYVTCDYIFAIDPSWAAKNTPGLLLATGRFRDGGQGSMGPALFAYGPWNEGDPPGAGASLKAVPLLRYGSVYDGPEAAGRTLKNYHHADDWAGGAWLTSGDRAAVIFVGTKGKGKCWYGFANGVVWPEAGPWPPVPPYPNDQRGWWSTEFVGQMLFYDPADLAAVACGKKKPWEPQPYAVMDLDPYLYGVTSKQKTRHVGDVTFDRQRGLVYLVEFRADGDKSLIHVFKIAAGQQQRVEAARESAPASGDQLSAGSTKDATVTAGGQQSVPPAEGSAPPAGDQVSAGSFKDATLIAGGQQSVPPAERSAPPAEDRVSARSSSDAILVDHACIDAKDQRIPREYLDKARQLDVYFGHQSVGWNLLEGLQQLTLQNAKRYSLDIVENPEATWFNSNSGIGHFYVGENYNPSSKIKDFSNRLTKEGYGKHARIAAMKFCFVDIDPGTNINAVWTSYRNTMETLTRAFPGVRFVWFTCPLVANDDNSKRHSFNQLVRQYCAGHGKILFDLADIEAYNPQGQPCRYAGFPALCKAYSQDGEHPDSAAGKLRLARAWWWLTSRLSGWKG